MSGLSNILPKRFVFVENSLSSPASVLSEDFLAKGTKSWHLDSRDGKKERLQLSRSDLEPFHFDQLLQPIRYEPITVLIIPGSKNCQKKRSSHFPTSPVWIHPSESTVAAVAPGFPR